MRLKLTLFIFVLIIAFVINCSKSNETYTIEIKDDVSYVHNNAPAWGDTLKVGLEFVQKIGVLEGKDENYWLYKPNGVVVDRENNIYILDSGNYRIQKFDPIGSYLATIGRQGQGPSEFERPNCINIGSEDTLYVGDYGGNHVITLSPNGKEIRRIKIPFVFDYFLRMRSGNMLMIADLGKKLESENIIEDTRLVSMLDENGNTVREFGKLNDYGNHLFNYLGNYFMMALDTDENIYISFFNQNRIEKYSSDGEILFRADRPLSYELSHKLEKQEVKANDVIVGYMDYAEFTDVSLMIDVDYKNRIWVQTYKKLKEEDDKPVDYFEFEIFDNDGILLGKLPIPQNFEIMRILKDRLYLIDSKEEMCVYEYKIVEK